MRDLAIFKSYLLYGIYLYEYRLPRVYLHIIVLQTSESVT